MASQKWKLLEKLWEFYKTIDTYLNKNPQVFKFILLPFRGELNLFDYLNYPNIGAINISKTSIFNLFIYRVKNLSLFLFEIILPSSISINSIT